MGCRLEGMHKFASQPLPMLAEETSSRHNSVSQHVSTSHSHQSSSFEVGSDLQLKFRQAEIACTICGSSFGARRSLIAVQCLRAHPENCHACWVASRLLRV